uniref:Uncharacterized protein n=1 Tax=Amphilophus citrinellus TaxID=61819 RepID=A0A3Q0RD37_AMPCI
MEKVITEEFMTQNIFQWSSGEQMNNMHQALNTHRQNLVESIHFEDLLTTGYIENNIQLIL